MHLKNPMSNKTNNHMTEKICTAKTKCSKKRSCLAERKLSLGRSSNIDLSLDLRFFLIDMNGQQLRSLKTYCFVIKFLHVINIVTRVYITNEWRPFLSLFFERKQNKQTKVKEEGTTYKTHRPSDPEAL